MELKKDKYEQELERSLIEIINMSKVCKKLRQNNRPEPDLQIVDIVKPVNESDPQQKPRELAHEEQEDNIINFQAQNVDLFNFDPLFTPFGAVCTDAFLPDPPALERIWNHNLDEDIQHRNKFQKKKKYIKKYTKSDILAALEEVGKGRSVLQVSKQFNIPSRTLYDKAKKMGIRTIRNRRNDKITEKQPFSGLTNIQKHVFLQGMLSENGIEDLVELDWIRFLM